VTFWDTQANRWGVFSVPDEDYDKYTARQAAFIVEQLDVETGFVVDMGCGIGRLTHPIAETLSEVQVVGVDPSDAMRRTSRAADQSEVSAHLATLGAFLPKTLDGAWCVLVFQHLAEAPTREILRDVAGVLKPGGRFVTQWMLDKDQAFPREADVLRVLMDEGFENVRLHGDADVTRLWFADNWLWVTSERTP